MGSVISHIRYGVRMLVRRPGLNATAIIALALGIGLTTTMFSIVYVFVIRGLPFEDSDELTALFRNRPAQGVEFMGVSIHDFQDWRSQQTSFESLAAYYAETVNVGGTEGQPIATWAHMRARRCATSSGCSRCSAGRSGRKRITRRHHR